MGILKKLVKTEEAMEKFIADYRIPPIGTGFEHFLLLDEWSQAQLTQYNKFVENEFKNWFLV